MPDYYEISLSCTLECNAECAHCCVDAGPKRRTRLSLDQMENYIESASDFGIKYIAFTGGEPTVHLQDLLKALKFAHSKSIKNIVVTNASWATDDSTSNQIAEEFASRGVIEVQVSTDMFHTRFIPFSNVLRAITAVRKHKMKPIVMLTRIKGDIQTTTLKEELSRHGIEIVEQSVVPFSGRSQRLEKGRIFSEQLQDMKYTGCISVLSPTISPQQKVYACCASDFSFADGSALCLGDLRYNSVKQVLGEHTYDRILDSLYLWGPKFLFDLIKNSDPQMLDSFPSEFYGYCHLCYQLLKRKKIVELLRSILDDESLIKRIRIAKIVKHEKIRQIADSRNEWYECVIEREES